MQDGGEVSLSDYKHNVLLIVNTASGADLHRNTIICRIHISFMVKKVLRYSTYRVVSLLNKYPVTIKRYTYSVQGTTA